MKILVNATTAVVGGGAQVAANFIVNTIKEPHGHSFFYCVSPLVAEHISRLLPELPHDRLVVLSVSPARIRRGRGSRRILLKREALFTPSLVYSVTSPSYVRFSMTPEVARFTNSWFTHPSTLAFSVLSASDRLKARARHWYKGLFLRGISHFQTQTRACANGLIRRLNLDEGRVTVIPNSYHPMFRKCDHRLGNELKTAEEKVVFVLAHPYPQKNLAIVPSVARVVRSLGVPIKFVMTLPEEHPQTRKICDLASRLGVRSMVQNVGRLSLEDCMAWYRRCDVVFLPTLLETFSATYLEAMAMGRPIVTPDLDFSREICRDAAEYFDPLNADRAAQAILNVVQDESRFAQLVENGAIRIRKFPSPQEQYRMQIEWLEDVSRRIFRDE